MEDFQLNILKSLKENSGYFKMPTEEPRSKICMNCGGEFSYGIRGGSTPGPGFCKNCEEKMAMEVLKPLNKKILEKLK